MNNRQPLPYAEAVIPAKRNSDAWLWLLPVLALVFVGWLAWQAWHDRGLLLRIHFSDGHGLKAGDTLRYRGIAVGEVERVTLDSSLDGVEVELRLQSDASELARAGSRFWIVRPQLDLRGASGLDTLIGANYIGVLPGTGSLQQRFTGLTAPPLADLMEPGGLDIVLLTPGRNGLRPGAPISYRQVLIGAIVAVELAKDASAVEAHAYIKPRYINLIRSNTRFWRAGRARLSAGFDGLSLDLDTMPSLVLGGVNLAIPPDPGARVQPGARFELHAKPKSDWLEWVPGLALEGMTGAPEELPQPVALQLNWRQRSWYYLSRSRERQGRGLLLAEGLLAPADLLAEPDSALEGSTQLRITGLTDAKTMPLPIELLTPALARYPIELEHPSWPIQHIRTPMAAENVLIIRDAAEPVRYVGTERQQWSAESWLLEPPLPFDERWHGAVAVAERDQNVLGLLLVNDENYQLVPIPTEQIEE